MPKTILEVDVLQIKEAIEKLDSEDKIKLIEDLERESRRERWQALLEKIRQRYKKQPISDAQIRRICEEVRKERYERTKSRR